MSAPIPHAPSERAHPAAAALLASPAFLAAVALLLVNDHVLKAAYGNWITGKLSDFAGLFAFALFWTALLPRSQRAVFALTGAAFLLWKTPLAEPAIAAWNALGILPLARVVDYTDWIALMALVPAWRLARRPHAQARRPPFRLRRRLATVASAILATLASTATSIAPRFYSVPDHAGYPVAASRAEVGAGLRELALLSPERPDARRADGLETAADTVVVLVRQPPERRVHLWLEVRESAPGESTIRLIGARSEGPMPSADGLHRAYAAQVHDPLLAWLVRHRGIAPR